MRVKSGHVKSRMVIEKRRHSMGQGKRQKKRTVNICIVTVPCGFAASVCFVM
jgi:hypothetical protein